MSENKRKRKGERRDGLIQVIVDVGRTDDGKRIRKSFYGKTRAEAERKKSEYIAYIQGTPKTDLTVSQWIKEYLKAYPSNANPLYASQNIVPFNRVDAALGDRQLRGIREKDLQSFLSDLAREKGYSASTMKKQLQTLKQLFKKAYKNKLIEDDPSDDLKLPPADEGTHRALSQAEIRLINNHWNDEGNYAGLWIMIMLYAGLRRGEMMALQWDSVDMNNKTLSVNQTAVISHNKIVIEQRAKSKAGIRVIPICKPLYDALDSVPAASRTGFVCLSAKGQPLTETAVRRGLERFCDIAYRAANGYALNQSGTRNDLHKNEAPASDFNFRFHDLRHTFCTMLYDGGVDVKTAQYLLGHSDLSVTMKIYTHLSEAKRTSSTAAMLSHLDSYANA